MKISKNVLMKLLQERDGDCVFCSIGYDDSPMKRYVPSGFSIEYESGTHRPYLCCGWHYALMMTYQSPEKKVDMRRTLKEYLDNHGGI